MSETTDNSQAGGRFAPAPGSETPPEERRQCDRCMRKVTVKEWARCPHYDCRAFYASTPEVPTH